MENYCKAHSEFIMKFGKSPLVTIGRNPDVQMPARTCRQGSGVRSLPGQSMRCEASGK